MRTKAQVRAELMPKSTTSGCRANESHDHEFDGKAACLQGSSRTCHPTSLLAPVSADARIAAKVAWTVEPTVIESEGALLERFCSRAMLTPVTHEVGIQVNVRTDHRDLMHTRIGSVAKLALQHALELESVHRDHEGRAAPLDLVMERRPDREPI